MQKTGQFGWRSQLGGVKVKVVKVLKFIDRDDRQVDDRRSNSSLAIACLACDRLACERRRTRSKGGKTSDRVTGNSCLLVVNLNWSISNLVNLFSNPT